MKNIIAQNNAIAIIAAPSAAPLASLGNLLKDYHKADGAFENAQRVRVRCITAFADTCKAMGWNDLSAIKPKGQHRVELMQVAAESILPAKALAAFNSDMAAYKTGADGKRIYSAKHNAGTIVANFLARLIVAAEAMMANAPQGEGEGEGEGEGKGNGANANKAKGLAEYMATTFADMIKRNGNDARKETPTGKAHGDIKVALDAAAKTIAALLK